MTTLIERMGTRLARSRLGEALFGDERRRQADTIRLMSNAYQAGPWLLPPEQLMAQLAEVDPWQVYATLDLRAYEMIGGYGTDTEQERTRAINESRRLYKYNPLAQWSVWMWTSWGLGDRVMVTSPDNERANEVIREFWQAERNSIVLAEDRIDDQSNFLLVDGNRYYCFFISTLDGEARVRVIPQDEMSAVSNPQDATDIWFYKRQWTPSGGTQRTLYYPDWRTLFGDPVSGASQSDRRWSALVKAGVVSERAERADKPAGDEELGDAQPQTVACILFVPHNIKDERHFIGWPLLANPRAWMQAHQHLMESRLSLAENASMYVRRKQVTGGSRAVKSVIDSIASNLSQSRWLDTNPPPVAGAVEVDNQQITTTDLPLITGAGDTAEDNRTFSWMALLGAGLFPTSAGLDTARWATALEMDKAQSSLFENYRGFWKAQFRRMATVVVLARERYGRQTVGEYTVSVAVDSFSLADFPAIARTIGQFVQDTITPMVANLVIRPNDALRIVGRLWRIALNALGVDDADELTSDEALGIPTESPAGESDAGSASALVVLENMARQAEWAAETMRRRAELGDDDPSQYMP